MSKKHDFIHGRSFVMSVLSDSLTVAHLSWAFWANRSQSLICPEQFWADERWVNERIPNPKKIQG